ncbi:MAG: hypothetical protein WC073_10955 [Sterolibacterium sp.]
MTKPRAADSVPTPQQTAIAARFAARLEACAHSQKAALVAEACAELGGISPATFYRWAVPHTVSDRKRRSDSGVLALTRQEAEIVSAALMEGFRQNNRKVIAVKRMVEDLRANGKIMAGRVDTETGEISELSDSSIHRALRAYNLHPEQLRRPTPHVPLSSPYPNHTWQVDASVCLVFYLPGGGTSIVELDQAIHYKNKPENEKAIELFRVIRYVVADHCSGVVRWRYYPHAETGEHTVRFMAWAMAPKNNTADPFHGRPEFLMVDPGATSAGLVKRFCRRLEITLIVNKRRNPRAKGSVEKGNHLVELVFEGPLKFQRHTVRDFDDLNKLAEMYQLHWNATAKHTRHGMSRFGKWVTIPADKLFVTPDAAVLLSLGTEEPIRRTVSGDLSVSFKGRTWFVGEVPGVQVKGHVFVHWHPFLAETAMAVVEDAEGEHHHALPEITYDANGFPSNAREIGKEFHAQKDTELETNRKRIAQIASGTSGVEADEKARAIKGYVPFGGEIDTFKTAKETPAPAWLPKRGTALDVTPVIVHEIPYSFAEAAMQVRAALGESYGPDHVAWLRRKFGDAPVPRADLASMIAVWIDNEAIAKEAEC